MTLHQNVSLRKQFAKTLPATAIGMLVAILIFLVIAFIDTKLDPTQNRVDATASFTKTYTDVGKCLSRTPYDPSKGAQTALTKFSNTDVLIVITQGANSYTPSVLMFSVDTSLFGEPQLRPADYQTTAFIANQCQMFTGGV